MKKATPKNKRQITQKKNQKTSSCKNPCLGFFHNKIKKIPKAVTIFVTIICVVPLFIFIKNKSEENVALKYLYDKYGKQFVVRKDHSAPDWIGKPPTYHGLAKVKDGSDDVEFVVVCGLDNLVCSDFYEEELEELKIKNELLKYVRNNLLSSVTVDVGLLENDPLSNKKINVRFHDRSELFDYDKVEKIMDSLENFKKARKDLIIGVHYAFYENGKKSLYCNLKSNEKITPDCFERVIR